MQTKGKISSSQKYVSGIMCMYIVLIKKFYGSEMFNLTLAWKISPTVKIEYFKDQFHEKKIKISFKLIYF